MDNEAAKAFESAKNVLNDLNQSGTLNKISGLSKEAFMSIVATMIDIYGGINGMSSSDIFDMMDVLVGTMHEVHDVLGGL